MHIIMASLIAALVAGVLLLAIFELFTKTPLGRRIEAEERRRRTRLD